jgi:hypothetical protein
MVNTRLSEEAFREQIRTMHADQMPLLDMVDALGLTREMSGAVRSIVQRLGPAEVDAIRKATLEMLDRAENEMPLDCTVEQSDIDGGAPVSVTVVEEEGGRRTVRVRPA